LRAARGPGHRSGRGGATPLPPHLKATKASDNARPSVRVG
jgi:hypothetical protein